MFIDKVIDEIPRLFILQFPFSHARFAEELLQFRIDVGHIEATVRIPPDMTDMLEICR